MINIVVIPLVFFTILIVIFCIRKFIEFNEEERNEMKEEWKIRIRLVANEECFEVYRHKSDGTEESEGLFSTQKEAYKVANKLNTKK